MKEKVALELVNQEAQTALSSLPSAWKLSEKGLNAIKHGVSMHQTQHGLYASIPMLCKGAECQYASVCPMVDAGIAPEGERCPLEISLILTKYDAYKRELGIEQEDTVDNGLLKDLIDLDVQLMRAENKMAVDGDFVKDVVIGVNESGKEVTQEQITKAAEYKNQIMMKRHKVLELLNSTRKDKAGQKISLNMDPSTYAADILSKIANRPLGHIIDIEELEVLED